MYELQWKPDFSERQQQQPLFSSIGLSKLAITHLPWISFAVESLAFPQISFPFRRFEKLESHSDVYTDAKKVIKVYEFFSLCGNKI